MGNSNLTNNHGLRVRRDGPCTPTLRHTGHLEKHYGAKVVLLKIEAEAEELMQLRGQPQLHPEFKVTHGFREMVASDNRQKTKEKKNLPKAAISHSPLSCVLQ